MPMTVGPSMGTGVTFDRSTAMVARGYLGGCGGDIERALADGRRAGTTPPGMDGALHLGDLVLGGQLVIGGPAAGDVAGGLVRHSLVALVGGQLPGGGANLVLPKARGWGISEAGYFWNELFMISTQTGRTTSLEKAPR